VVDNGRLKKGTVVFGYGIGSEFAIHLSCRAGKDALGKARIG
jgi:hypothetical protein